PEVFAVRRLARRRRPLLCPLATPPGLPQPFRLMPKYVVRTGVMRALGVYSTGRDATYLRNAQVVVRSDRGLEIGEVLCEATEAALAQLSDPGTGQILRLMSADDARQRSRLLDQARQEFQTCQRLIGQLQLEMRLIDVEHIFGGERV